MIKLYTFFVLIFVGTHFVQAQKQNHIWTFGHNGGLDFNFEPAKPLRTAISANEGTASICDPSGNLLFYTDGITVWDRFHHIMPNGTGLAGGPSSAQAALIVPVPFSDSEYIIFTTKDYGSEGGLYYSCVDMKLNFGLGDINSKNKLLDPNASEHLSSILHDNGTDIWVITHHIESDEFASYLIDSIGVSTHPIISHTGSVYPPDAVIGMIKPSHDGSSIATSSLFHNSLDLTKFDNATGVISDHLDLETYFTEALQIYGVEFSPNDSLMYFTARSATNMELSFLYQIDLLTHELTLLSSNQSDAFYGSLQLGPDNQIYLAEHLKNYVSIIHKPNLQGSACEFERAAVSLLKNTYCNLGLHNNSLYSFSNYIDPSVSLGRDTFICHTTSLILKPQFPSNCTIESFAWNDNSADSILLVSAEGLYWVEVSSDCGTFRDSIYVSIANCSALIYYSLDSCRSYMSDNSHMDYSEFEAAYPVILSCGSVNADHLKRSDAAQKHSCTQGIEGSVAMCIGSLQDCEFQPGHPLSIVFEFDITPAIDSITALSQITFYHKSPEQYSWIDGPSGPNNPPAFFGISIYKNDELIFRETQVPTGNEWTQATFGFIGDTVFEVADPAHFRIEILPYCPTDNGASESVWDIDEISVFGFCKSIPKTLPSIFGYVKTYEGQPVFPAEVRLSESRDFQTYLSTITAADGGYRFSDLEPGIAYYITAYKNDNTTDGITTKDLIGLQKHLLRISPYMTLHKLIASDINADDRINVIDLFELRKTVLDMYVSFPYNTSWRFGPATQNFISTDLPAFEEIHQIESLGNEDLEINFTGIKVGDPEQN